MGIDIQQTEVIQEIPNTLTQKLKVYVQERFEDFMEDPLGMKRRIWEDYDERIQERITSVNEWAATAKPLEDNWFTIINPKSIHADIIPQPPFPRPKSMLRGTPNFLVQQAKAFVRERFEDLMEDPIGIKRRQWERWDRWEAAVRNFAERGVNQRFLSSDDINPKFPRPRSMKRNKTYRYN